MYRNKFFNKKISTKISILYGDKDNLSSVENIENILYVGGDINSYFLKDWGHATYLWGKDKSKMFNIFDDILLE